MATTAISLDEVARDWRWDTVEVRNGVLNPDVTLTAEVDEGAFGCWLWRVIRECGDQRIRIGWGIEMTRTDAKASASKGMRLWQELVEDRTDAAPSTDQEI